jgi:hypothetical protein
MQGQVERWTVSDLSPFVCPILDKELWTPNLGIGLKEGVNGMNLLPIRRSCYYTLV